MALVALPAVKRTRIVAIGGTARDVQILDGTGQPIDWGDSGVSKVVIHPIEPDGLIRATVTIDMVDLG